ncbi:MAG: hypothetical protein H0T46_31405 [Deltaproteobacteria bacterium]|nr:hypothetical protein [Deltaproteobacteria bacterium]
MTPLDVIRLRASVMSSAALTENVPLCTVPIGAPTGTSALNTPPETNMVGQHLREQWLVGEQLRLGHAELGEQGSERRFYSSTGELAELQASVDDRDVPAPETTPNAYTAGSPGTTSLFVVATDETGGMSATSVPLTIE